MVAVSTARGDLASDVTDLAARWSATVSRCSVFRRCFWSMGGRGGCVFPRRRGVGAGAGAKGFAAEGPCTTLAFLAGRSTDFVVKMEPVTFAKHLPVGGRVERSVAGGVFVSECLADARGARADHGRSARRSIGDRDRHGHGCRPPAAHRRDAPRARQRADRGPHRSRTAPKTGTDGRSRRALGTAGARSRRERRSRKTLEADPTEPGARCCASRKGVTASNSSPTWWGDARSISTPSYANATTERLLARDLK